MGVRVRAGLELRLESESGLELGLGTYLVEDTLTAGEKLNFGFAKVSAFKDYR